LNTVKPSSSKLKPRFRRLSRRGRASSLVAIFAIIWFAVVKTS
jgi:hypothetical protein